MRIEASFELRVEERGRVFEAAFDGTFTAFTVDQLSLTAEIPPKKALEDTTPTPADETISGYRVNLLLTPRASSGFVTRSTLRDGGGDTTELLRWSTAATCSPDGAADAAADR